MKNPISPSDIKKLCSTAIFKDVDEEMLFHVLNTGGAVVERFKSGEALMSDEKYARRLGLILKGKAQVSKQTGSHRVVMSRLYEGSLFGAVTLFSSADYYATDITALSTSTALFIEKDLMSELMKQDTKIGENYIAYLSERIYFLNSKITSFTATSAEGKLATYIKSKLSSNTEDFTILLDVSLSELAAMLDIGRASLYRGIKELSDRGIIFREGKLIKVIDVKKLEDFL